MATKHQRAGVDENMEARRVEVLALRIKGASLRSIASQVGVSHETVSKDLKASMGLLIKEQVAKAGAYRAVELARLEALHEALWDAAIGNAAEGKAPDLYVLDRVLKVGEARRKLLGIDAPVTQVNEQAGKLTIEMIEVSASALSREANDDSNEDSD